MPPKTAAQLAREKKAHREPQVEQVQPQEQTAPAQTKERPMSTKLEITTRAPKVKDAEGNVVSATFFLEVGETTEENVKIFGEKVVNSHFLQSVKISAQGVVRSALEKGKSPAEIPGMMASWKPGVSVDKTVDPEQALLAKWASMGNEEKAALLAKLQG